MGGEWISKSGQNKFKFLQKCFFLIISAAQKHKYLAIGSVELKITIKQSMISMFEMHQKLPKTVELQRFDFSQITG